MKNISFKKFKPTKTNLLLLEKKLKFTVRGENFLEFKREQIINEIKRYFPEYLSLRKEFLDLYKQAIKKLFKTYEDMGTRNFYLISKMSKIQFAPKVSIEYIKQMGIIIPSIKYKLKEEKQLPAYSFENTSHHLDDLIKILINLFQTLNSLAEKEDMVLKYALNFKKLNRRINGLKNIIIPQLQQEIKIIKEILEEIDRENFVRLKKVKSLIIK